MQILFHGTGFYQPGKCIGPARWPHHDVIAVPDGAVVLETGGREFALAEGDALIIPPGNEFLGTATTPAATIWVLHFTGYPAAAPHSPFHSESAPFLIPGVCRQPRDRMLIEEFTRLWSPQPRLATAPVPRPVELLGELIVARMEAALLCPPRPEPSRLRAAVAAALHGGPGDPVARMARAAGLGPSRFRQTFQEQYGQSPARFVQQARMEEARRLLSETALPIKEIGQRVGYRQLAAFHRAFKKETGTTPAAHRRRFAGVA